MFDSIFNDETTTRNESGFNCLIVQRELILLRFIRIDENEELILFTHQLVIGEHSDRV